jgi:hypothetical protein
VVHDGGQGSHMVAPLRRRAAASRGAACPARS